MIRQTAKYQLPDQGFTLVRWAHQIAHGRTAVVVDTAVEHVRRGDGALTVADLSRYRRAADGPLSVLRLLLELEATATRRWSKAGFGRFRRWSAGRQVLLRCHQHGVEAAVDWALSAGAPDRLDVAVLREQLGAQLYRTEPFDEKFFTAELARALHEQRQQHKLGRR